VGLEERVPEHLQEVGDRARVGAGRELLEVEVEELRQPDEQRRRERLR
jgi:hypothetical protein